ncbi:DUF5333 domain-containing protein [Octadecabacter sp. G9-8]|uniref:DUF5333 domain-containing protein n=1 Tax=Octadecabacter dasysiphoniae TaxID=2909341 RepID=A0ABS9CZA5_9RHOB|nr:DUF5333 domain-containing protein [Octadecabacter dasysiphoniae]MCF2872122.1 DUF5333 domain-containing protein [Octadecabacter dasysiphoniae]
MTSLKHTLSAAILGAFFAVPAVANPANVTFVTEGIINAGMAVELDDNCNEVSVRMIRGLNFLQGLKSHLRNLGYSNADIDAFIDNDAEKDRLEAIARQRLSDLGVVVGDASTYCAVARGQIAQDTQIGQLLR